MVSKVDFWLGQERFFVVNRFLRSYLEVPSTVIVLGTICLDVSCVVNPGNFVMWPYGIA